MGIANCDADPGHFYASTNQDRYLGGSLIWMGVACIANAARCGRIHCYLTGPFFLAMAAVTVAHGTGMISLGSRGWLWIGAAVALGTLALWIAPERLFGRFLTHDRSG